MQQQASKGETFETVVQVIIMLAIGGAGAAASFGHVISVVSNHGQEGWFAVADAVVLELMAVSCGLEMRRRRKHGQSVRLPFVALVVAVGLSLSAQVIEAEPTIIGWVAAAIPSLGFLVQAKMILGRHSKVEPAVSAPVADVAPAISQTEEMAELESPDLPEAPVSPAVPEHWSPVVPVAPDATAKRKPYGPRGKDYSERQERRQRTGK